jgi:hypothetical protein
MNVNQVVRRAFVVGVVMTSLVTIVASIVGALVAGLEGTLAALVGGAVAFALLGLTPLSILWGFRLGNGDLLSPAFFASVLGTWLLKFVAFLAIVLWLGDQTWLERTTLFITIVVALLVGLVSDLVVVARSRMPYVSDVSLPGEKV